VARQACRRFCRIQATGRVNFERVMRLHQGGDGASVVCLSSWILQLGVWRGGDQAGPRLGALNCPR
jgi:hypothetical protein